jgi:hypothetical protein
MTDYYHRTMKGNIFKDCQYNSIERMVSGVIINIIQSMTFDSKPRVANTWLQPLSNFNEEMWKNCVQHCENLIKQDWQKLWGISLWVIFFL